MKIKLKKAFEYWATIVDEQNIKDNNYVKMSGVKNSNAYMAGLELVFNGRLEFNGYTENILTKWRLKQKSERK